MLNNHIQCDDLIEVADVINTLRENGFIGKKVEGTYQVATNCPMSILKGDPTLQDEELKV